MLLTRNNIGFQPRTLILCGNEFVPCCRPSAPFVDVLSNNIVASFADHQEDTRVSRAGSRSSPKSSQFTSPINWCRTSGSVGTEAARLRLGDDLDDLLALVRDTEVLVEFPRLQCEQPVDGQSTRELFNGLGRLLHQGVAVDRPAARVARRTVGMVEDHDVGEN